MDGTTFAAEAKYPINWTQSGTRFVLNLNLNGNNEINNFLYQFKAEKLRNKRLGDVLRWYFTIVCNYQNEKTRL